MTPPRVPHVDPELGGSILFYQNGTPADLAGKRAADERRVRRAVLELQALYGPLPEPPRDDDDTQPIVVQAKANRLERLGTWIKSLL